MLQMLRDLVAHKGYADAALLRAVRENETAASDAELWQLLHHVLLANRFWLLTVRGLPFVHEVEAALSLSYDVLVDRYRDTQAEETAWLSTATEADLGRMLEDTRIPGGACLVWQSFVQVCLHAQGHRAQCAKLVRRHGGVPPSTDFILWLVDRPRPEWTAGDDRDAR